MKITYNEENNTFMFFVNDLNRPGEKEGNKITIEIDAANGTESSELALKVASCFNTHAEAILKRSASLVSLIEVGEIRLTIDGMIDYANEVSDRITKYKSNSIDEALRASTIKEIDSAISSFSAFNNMSDDSIGRALYVIGINIRESHGEVVFSAMEIEDPLAYIRVDELSIESLLSTQN